VIFGARAVLMVEQLSRLRIKKLEPNPNLPGRASADDGVTGRGALAAGRLQPCRRKGIKYSFVSAADNVATQKFSTAIGPSPGSCDTIRSISCSSTETTLLLTAGLSSKPAPGRRRRSS
jgi:hypothetical protein